MAVVHDSQADTPEGSIIVFIGLMVFTIVSLITVMYILPTLSLFIYSV